ncbi:MAG: hypothetical protein JXA41_13485 [Deltaproteobacteria bacterium]|nr:hypothetical protein [Deltaproteobacteria bacterium]
MRTVTINNGDEGLHRVIFRLERAVNEKESIMHFSQGVAVVTPKPQKNK